MKKILARYGVLPFLMILGLCIFCACGKDTEKQTQGKLVSASGTVSAEKEYDECITGVIKSIDEETETIVVLETATAAETVLTYTDFTEAANQYGDIKTVEQFQVGDIVDVCFWMEQNEIVKMENSASAWEYEDIRKFTVQREDRIFKISDRRYQYDPISLIVSQDGELMDLLAVNEQDTLSVQGIGSRIYSITVTKGHGYVRFANYDQFVGGMVEVGYGIIRNVTEDMLLVVPEGTYRMVMDHGMLRAEKQIMVERGKELVVDLGAYQMEVEKTGKVYFVISPEGAQLNVNGVPMVYTNAIELNYGKNIIQVFQEGYASYTGKLSIKKPYQVVKISLAADSSDAEVVSSEDEEADESEMQDTDSAQESSGGASSDTENDDPKDSPSDEETDHVEDENTEDKENDSDETDSEKTDDEPEETSDSETDSDETTIESADTETTETDSSHTVTVNSPTGVKVYVNGDYIGKSPVSFDKIIGTFTVALSKNGYQTASYTLTMEDDGESNFLSFPDLAESE